MSARRGHGTDPPRVAVCGKGGVGKTVVSALLARVLVDGGVGPLLLVDADPVTGLTAALGQPVNRTLADVREQLLRTAASSDGADRERLARELDYRVLEVLSERDGYALLAMGRSTAKGCFCPVNTLLKHALASLATAFEVVIIDAEAGVEHVQREVTSRVTRAVVVTDGSARSRHVARLMAELLGGDRVVVVANRSASLGGVKPEPTLELELVGAIPEDRALAELDRLGRPLWDLPPDNPALRAVADIARRLGLLDGGTRMGGET
jgi:CO dehydrogenase maturation factor